MAMADYRLCDVCGGKVFYDANLNYDQGPDEWHDTPPFKEVGEPQYQSDDLNKRAGYRLDYLGDWAVLCTSCAKTYKTVILPIGE